MARNISWYGNYGTPLQPYADRNGFIPELTDHQDQYDYGYAMTYDEWENLKYNVDCTKMDIEDLIQRWSQRVKPALGIY